MAPAEGSEEKRTKPSFMTLVNENVKTVRSRESVICISGVCDDHSLLEAALEQSEEWAEG